MWRLLQHVGFVPERNIRPTKSIGKVIRRSEGRVFVRHVARRNLPAGATQIIK
jgi:hypothetical protein